MKPILMPTGRIFFGSWFDKTYEIAPDGRAVEATVDHARFINDSEIPLSLADDADEARAVLADASAGLAVDRFVDGKIIAAD